MFRCLHKCLTFIRDRRGTAAIEFAFVGPLLIVLTIGIIDVGRVVWSASFIDHLASEGTRFASVRGANSASPVTEDQVKTFLQDQVIAMDLNDLSAVVTFNPDNLSGSTIQVQIVYQYSFLLGKLVGLDPVQLRGDSVMVVL